MMPPPIFFSGREVDYIKEAIAIPFLRGGGPFTQKCAEWLQETLSAKSALLTTSCTSALEMAALLCDIGPGDEIIMPSFTFTSTATAFVSVGATPVFVDISPHDCNIAVENIKRAVTPRTKAIVPVHYAGNTCDMDCILDIAKEYNFFVIEDAAQALLSTYNGKFAGTLGDFGCISFHESKNVQCGEGGALLVNNEKFVERAKIILEKGTNRDAFLHGQVDKYTWVDKGSSYVLSDLNAAFLLSQLEAAHFITQRKREIYLLYLKLLEPLFNRRHIGPPLPAQFFWGNGHIFYIITESMPVRALLIKWLKEHDIDTFFHYVPLHSSPAGMKFGCTPFPMPHTEKISDCLLRLPCYPSMKDEHVEEVVSKIFDFYSH